MANRAGLKTMCWWSGSSTASAARSRTSFASLDDLKGRAERSLIRERVNAGLAAARRRGRRGGRPPAIDPETVDQIVAALDGGSSKSAVCRTFKIARSTLNDTPQRIGWSGAGQHGSEKSKPNAQKPRAGEGEASQPRGGGTCFIPPSVPGGSQSAAAPRARPRAGRRPASR